MAKFSTKDSTKIRNYMDGSLEDVSAAIAAMTKGGIGAEETITGLRNAIKDIVSPSVGAAQAAKSLGLNFSKRLKVLNCKYQ